MQDRVYEGVKVVHQYIKKREMKDSRRAARNYDRRYSEVDSLRGKMKKGGWEVHRLILGGNLVGVRLSLIGYEGEK